MSKQMSEDCTRQTQKVLHYPLSYSGKDRIEYIIQGVSFENSRKEIVVVLSWCTKIFHLKIFEFFIKKKNGFHRIL